MRTSLPRRALPLLAAVALAALTLVAQPARADGPEEPPKGQPKEQPKAAPQADAAKRAAALEATVAQAFAAKRYEEAAAACRELIALRPMDDGAHYNLACALARLGKTPEALAALKTAVELGFADADHMGEDEDLASLRGEEAFGALVAAARAGESLAEERAYEPGADVAGVRSLEGQPASGLRWRLRLGQGASAQKPHRLVVWLHPSGGSMNARVEPLAKDLAERGFALLVLSAKGWAGWSQRDATRLLTGTLPDVAKVEGVDARRPLLLGFSAGGQMALVLWAKEPARWGGLVLDAAYPIDMEAYAKFGPGPDAMLKLPEGDGPKQTPIFALVGDADPGQMAWRAVEDAWRGAGVPLTVTYVPEGKHQWLFGPEQLTALWAWLSEVGAGRLPGAPTAPAKPEPK